MVLRNCAESKGRRAVSARCGATYSGYITLIMMTRFDQQGVMLVGFNANEGVAWPTNNCSGIRLLGFGIRCYSWLLCLGGQHVSWSRLEKWLAATGAVFHLQVRSQTVVLV
jgi:hypothetical protein